MDFDLCSTGTGDQPDLSCTQKRPGGQQRLATVIFLALPADMVAGSRYALQGDPDRGLGRLLKRDHRVTPCGNWCAGGDTHGVAEVNAATHWVARVCCTNDRQAVRDVLASGR